MTNDHHILMARSLFLIPGMILLTIFLQSCGIYSFTGASTSAKTITIRYFQNNSPLVNPTLSQVFTDALKDKFVSQTTLDLVPRGGELILEGNIINYETQPVAIQGNETAALNRLTITVHVKFTNTVEDNHDFETNFTEFKEYSSSKSLSEVQDDLIKSINDLLVEDIFNKAVVNW